MELNELIKLYADAWSEPDRVLRQHLLERVWVEDGTYTDPTTHLIGRLGLINHIDGVFEKIPGTRLEVTSEIEMHHDKFRFTWRMLLANGEVFLDGIDFGELDTNGKLHRIVGFFGALALKP